MDPPPGDVGVLEQLADFFGPRDADKLAFLDEAALQRVPSASVRDWVGWGRAG